MIPIMNNNNYTEEVSLSTNCMPSTEQYAFILILSLKQGFPGGSDGKESTCNAGDPSLIPGLRNSPGKVNSYPLQYSCLGNPMERGAWYATVHGITKSQTQLRLSMHTHDL